MIIGFTGTREGMSPRQAVKVAALVKSLLAVEGHHGDCQGADFEFDKILKQYSVRRIIHPPEDSSLRAFCQGDIILPPKGYLKRDVDIVMACDFLIATPRRQCEEVQGGTWYTIRHARKVQRKRIIIFPNGDYSDE